jgi:hypothetical protein
VCRSPDCTAQSAPQTALGSVPSRPRHTWGERRIEGIKAVFVEVKPKRNR